ncbi:MAG: hypothetical protein M1817_000549 [Caeruleum heppii]|nr:MAG: hypothetical protein M1817_000549 [Caeruleum heppii]
MAPQVLNRVCYGSATPPAGHPQRLTIKPAILHDYCRHRVRHCDYPAITPESGNTVRGTFVTGLTDGDIWRLDIFEGDEYARRPVQVKLLDQVGDETGKGNREGDAVEAETYVWIAGRRKLEAGEWDFGLFQTEKMGRWVREDEGFADVERAVETTAKDPTGGRGMRGDITNKLKDGRSKESLKSAV